MDKPGSAQYSVLSLVAIVRFGPHCRAVGFTLLELMLTISLIALTATFVGINVGQSDSRLARLEASRFVALLNMAADESVMTGRPIRLNVNAGARSYSFEPMPISSVFGKSDSSSAQSQDTEDEPEKMDELFREREFPEALNIEFIRLPDLEKEETNSRFVLKEVHELLNKSLFDRDDPLQRDEDKESSVTIEPNGLISPFTLTLSVENQVASVGLDRLGRAALNESE